MAFRNVLLPQVVMYAELQASAFLQWFIFCIYFWIFVSGLRPDSWIRSTELRAWTTRNLVSLRVKSSVLPIYLICLSTNQFAFSSC
jgi:hypothetical protein